MGTRVMGYVFFALLWLPGLAPADELILRNGDPLTGTLVGLAGGTISFDSAVFGSVTAPIEELEDFTIEQEIVIELEDGTIVTDRIVRGHTGRVHLAGDPSRAFEPGQIKRINPEKIAWHGSLAAGLGIERGDTDKEEADLDFRARWIGDLVSFRFRFIYGGDRSRTDGGDSTTHDRLYRGTTQLDRLLTERLFVYTRLLGERDGVADLDLRSILGGGFGYKC